MKMKIPKCPQLLQPGVAKHLNQKAFKKTGCFFFLSTEELPNPKPQTLKDAFLANVVALYSLYHDYGHNFLMLCLREDMLPQNVSSKMHYKAKHVYSHVNTICRCFRANLCHGTFKHNENDRIELIRLIGLYAGNRIDCGGSWPDAVIQMSEGDWEKASVQIIEESNELYEYLNNWIDLWGAKNDLEKQDLKKRFVDIGTDGRIQNWPDSIPDKYLQPIFLRALDKGLCIPIIRTVSKQVRRTLPSPDKIYTEGLNGRGGIYNWAKTLRTCLIMGRLCDPEGIYSELVKNIRLTIERPIGRTSK